MLSTILLIVFIAIFVIALLAGLIGFLKGLYKTSLKTILKIILVIIFIFTTPVITSAIGNIDLSGLNQSFNVNGTAVSLTSIDMTLADCLTALGYISPINGLSIYQTAIALAHAMLSYVVFLLLMLLVQLFISLITAIIYNGIFRWFLPVETGKEAKARRHAKEAAFVTNGLLDEKGEPQPAPRKKLHLLRWPGAALGAVQEFIFVCILLSPMTSLIRTVKKNQSTIDEAFALVGDQQNTVTQFDGIVNEASDSLLYKMLGIGNFDTAIMNHVSQVSVNGVTVSFDGLVTSTLDVAQPLLSSGAISYDQAAAQVTINFSKLLSASMIDTLTGTILENKMVMGLIPPLVDAAVISLSNGSFALNELDFSQVDWTNDITIFRSIYDEIGEKLVLPMISADGKTVSGSAFVIPSATMTDNDIATYAAALANLGRMDSVKKNLGTILSGMGVYLAQGGLDILPTDRNAYSSIDWSVDLPIIGTTVLKLFRTLGTDISAGINGNALSEATWNAIKDVTKRNAIEEILLSSDRNSLLDTGLFKTLNLGKVVSTTLSTIPSLKKYVADLDFESVLGNLTTVQVKNEFRTMFNVANLVFDTNSKINIEDPNVIDLGDEETCQELVSILETSQNSPVFKKLYPAILKALLFNNTFNFDSYLFGLTPYNFNYDADDFLDNFTTLLTMLPKITALTATMSDSSLTMTQKITQIDTTTIRDLLKVLVLSDFLNADVKTGGTGTIQKNANIYTFLNNFLTRDPLDKLNLSCPPLDALQGITWGKGEANDGGEITRLCTILDDIKANAAFFTSDDHALSKITDTAGFVDTINQCLDSPILNSSALKMLNDSLSTYLKDLGIPFSFNDMRTSLWKDDISEMAVILDLLKDVDITNWDLTTFSPTKLNALLTALDTMHFVQLSSDKNDPFGNVLYSLLAKQGLFTHLGITDPGCGAFLLSDATKWSLTTTSSTVMVGTESLIVTTTTTGEIAGLCDLFKACQDYGFTNLENGTLADSLVYSFSDAALSSSVTRSLLVNLIQANIAKVVIPDSYSGLLSGIDYTLLKTMKIDQLRREMLIFSEFSTLSNASFEGTNKLSYMLSNPYSIYNSDSTKNLWEDFVTLINRLSDTVLFSTVKAGQTLCPLGEMMVGVAASADVLDLVTLSGTTDTVINTYLYRGIVSTVTDWKTEILAYPELLRGIQGQSSSLLSVLGSLTKDDVLTLFNTANSMVCFHRFPIGVLRSDFMAEDIDSLLVDPETGAVVHELPFLSHIGTSAEDIAYWAADYENLVDLFYGDTTTGYAGLRPLLEGSSSFASINFKTLDTKVLYYIGRTNFFAQTRSYILYNLMKNSIAGGYSVSNLFKDSSDAPYGENVKVYRLEDLFFQNPKLLGTDGKLDKTKAIADLAIVDKSLNEVLDNAATLTQVSNLSDISLATSFASLMNSTVTLSSDGTTFYRSDLASELLAGLFTSMIENKNLDTTMGAANPFAVLKDGDGKCKVDFYADDYFLINVIEGRAMDGFIGLSKITPHLLTIAVPGVGTTSVPYYAKTDLTPMFDLFGNSATTTATSYQAVYDYFLAQARYAASSNAVLSTMASSFLTLLPVLNQVNTITSVSTLATANSDQATKNGTAVPDLASTSYAVYLAAISLG